MMQALRPVRRRVRLLRACAGLGWGTLAGLAICAVLAVASFLTPIERLLPMLGAALCACAALGLFAGTLIPCPAREAARRADRAGDLRERSLTALECANETGEMARVQREDALASLSALNARRAMPLRVRRAPALACAGLLAFSCALLLLPNPQHDVLRARENARLALRERAEQVERAAERVDERGLTEAERAQLRRLTDEAARALREADTPREALTRLSDTQREMERLTQAIQERMQAEAAEALSAQPGLSGVGAAMGAQGAEAAAASLGQMLSEADAEKMERLAEELKEAAEKLTGDARQAMAQSAAQAAAGQATAAAASLSQCASCSAGADLASLMQLARSGASSAGQSAAAAGAGAGSGAGTGPGAGISQSQGTGGGGGAGRGTTNQDAGYSEGLSQSAQGEGTGPTIDRTAAYERIYDPTRLGDGGEASLSAGERGEGENQQIELSPGQGSYDGSVPYADVVGEYAAAAAQASRRDALSETLQNLVTRYFDALID